MSNILNEILPLTGFFQFCNRYRSICNDDKDKMIFFTEKAMDYFQSGKTQIKIKLKWKDEKNSNSIFLGTFQDFTPYGDIVIRVSKNSVIYIEPETIGEMYVK